MTNENKENFWSKLWKGIVNFFKKGWTLLILPIGLFIISLFIKKKEGKKEIKEKEKEIKADKKEIEKKEKEVITKEKEVEKVSEEAKEMIEKQKQSKQKRETELSDILPDLKK